MKNKHSLMATTRTYANRGEVLNYHFLIVADADIRNPGSGRHVNSQCFLGPRGLSKTNNFLSLYSVTSYANVITTMQTATLWAPERM